MDKRRKVLAYAARLDKIAEEVETNYNEYGLDEKQAQAFVFQIDSLADRMMESHGLNPRALENIKDALVVERDADEPYMDTFGQPDVMEHDSDETDYMIHMMDGSNSDEFHNPLVDGLGNDTLIHAGDDEDEDSDDDEDDEKEASFDWWDDDSREASDSTPERKTDYWV